MTEEIDRDTPEGVYTEDQGSVVNILRVRGDCTVQRMPIARSESEILMIQLANLVGWAKIEENLAKWNKEHGR